MSNFQLTGTTKVESFYDLFFDLRKQKILMRITRDKFNVPFAIFPTVTKVEGQFPSSYSDVSLAEHSQFVYRFVLCPRSKNVDLIRSPKTTRGSDRSLWAEHYRQSEMSNSQCDGGRGGVYEGWVNTFEPLADFDGIYIIVVTGWR